MLRAAADRSVAAQASEVRGDFQWGLERFVDEARTLVCESRGKWDAQV